MMDMIENMLAVIVTNDTTTMKLYIKNMVCSRCKMVVKSKLEKLELHPIFVELCEVYIQENNIENIKAVFALVRIPTHHSLKSNFAFKKSLIRKNGVELSIRFVRNEP